MESEELWHACQKYGLDKKKTKEKTFRLGHAAVKPIFILKCVLLNVTSATTHERQNGFSNIPGSVQVKLTEQHLQNKVDYIITSTCPSFS